MELKSVFKSVTGNKCPNCLKGDFFISRNPYNLKKLGDMHNRCEHCGMDFRQEPGFYFGAAIMSYVLQVIMIFPAYFFCLFTFDISVERFIFVVAIMLILAAPVNFRVSRILWINLLGSRPK